MLLWRDCHHHHPLRRRPTPFYVAKRELTLLRGYPFAIVWAALPVLVQSWTAVVATATSLGARTLVFKDATKQRMHRDRFMADRRMSLLH